MPMPPFADLAAYASALTELVPDAKAQRTDQDLVSAALLAYAEAYPSWATAAIGDGTTVEWPIGTAPLDTVLVGFSDLLGIEVELIDGTDAPYRPREILVEGSDFWLDRRTVAGVATTVLVFLDAPSRVRVRWRTRWAAADVPLAHQMAVVYRAAALKCENLAAVYASTVDPTATAADFFSGGGKVAEYRSLAKDHHARANAVLGVGNVSASMATGICKRGRREVFRR